MRQPDPVQRADATDRDRAERDAAERAAIERRVRIVEATLETVWDVIRGRANRDAD